MLTIDVDNLSDRQLITAIAKELHAEDHAADTPQIALSANKILAEYFFNNPSNGNLDHYTMLLSVPLRSAKSGHLNSG